MLYGAYIEGMKTPFATTEAYSVVEAANKLDRVIWACTDATDHVEIRRVKEGAA
jgi:hypothetical protein